MAALDTHTTALTDAATQNRTSFAARAGVCFCFLAASALLVSGLVGNTHTGKLSVAPGAVLAINTGAQGK